MRAEVSGGGLATMAEMSKRRNSAGFTLIEVMIVVAILGILAAIGMPIYRDYVRRSQSSEAASELSAYRVRMEQYYQDNRKYSTADDSACGITAPTTLKYFTLSCSLNTCSVPGTTTNQAYCLTATGVTGKPTGGTVYTIDSSNARTTTQFQSVTQTGKSCWLISGSEC